MSALDTAALISLFSQAIGYAIILGALILKLPQIKAIIDAGSAEGLSLMMFIMEIVAFSISASYNINKGNPISAWGENIVILVQVYVIVYLILSYNGNINAMWLILSSAYFATFGCMLLGFVPMHVLALLQSSNVLVSIVSRVPQIMTNYENKDVGCLSTTTCFLNFAGSAARVFTTISQLGGDMAILAGFSTATLLNFVLFAQCVVYRKDTRVKQE